MASILADGRTKGFEKDAPREWLLDNEAMAVTAGDIAWVIARCENIRQSSRVQGVRDWIDQLPGYIEIEHRSVDRVFT